MMRYPVRCCMTNAPRLIRPAQGLADDIDVGVWPRSRFPGSYRLCTDPANTGTYGLGEEMTVSDQSKERALAQAFEEYQQWYVGQLKRHAKAVARRAREAAAAHMMMQIGMNFIPIVGWALSAAITLIDKANEKKTKDRIKNEQKKTAARIEAYANQKVKALEPVIMKAMALEQKPAFDEVKRQLGPQLGLNGFGEGGYGSGDLSGWGDKIKKIGRQAEKAQKDIAKTGERIAKETAKDPGKGFQLTVDLYRGKEQVREAKRELERVERKAKEKIDQTIVEKRKFYTSLEGRRKLRDILVREILSDEEFVNKLRDLREQMEAKQQAAIQRVGADPATVQAAAAKADARSPVDFDVSSLPTADTSPMTLAALGAAALVGTLVLTK